MAEQPVPAADTIADPSTREAYVALIKHVREASLLGGCASILSWDQETMMPPGGLPFRGQQMALLSRLLHERHTDPRIGEWLATCEADTNLTADEDSVPAVNVRELRRGYDRATKLPADLVQEIAETSTQAKSAWAKARQNGEFSGFEPWLQKTIELNRRKAECYGWPEDGEPWDALAEGFEPGSTATEIAGVFGPLRVKLVELIDALRGAKDAPGNRINEAKFPANKQRAFVKAVVQRFGFDFERGRLDESTHPFTGGSHCNDVRMTTRFRDDNLLDALGSTMHESGHGMYSQGLPEEHIGTPMGGPVSLGIHESQSRLWENQVGRSRAFWEWAHELLPEYFGEPGKGYSVEELYRSSNRVLPDFIRVEADEATYNLHIMVRFEIERALIRGDLQAKEVPEAWNTRYKEYLGIDVPDDTKGCLQDIHWSMGALGYFPTYTLGNLYSAQFFETLRADIPDLDSQVAKGEFSSLLAWLNKNIHAQGQRYCAGKLCEVVTGKPLSPEPLLRHLNDKYRAVYGV